MVRPFLKLNNMIWGVSKHLSPRFRMFIIDISLLGLSFLGILRHLGWDIKEAIGYNTGVSTGVAVALLILVVLCSVDRPVEQRDVRINPLFWSGWILCFSMILLTSLFNEVYFEYVIWAAVSLILLLPYAIAWSVRGDYESICVRLSQCVLLASDIFFVLNLLIVPFIPSSESAAYAGLAVNPNSNGVIATGAGCAALFLLFLGKQRPSVCILTISFSLGLAFASGSRTAAVTIVLEAFLGFIYFFRNTKRGRKRRNLLKKCFVVIAAVVVLSAMTAFVFRQIRTLDLNSYAAVKASVRSPYKDKGELYIALDKTLSGRLLIWEAFIEKSTFWGNGTPTGPIRLSQASQYAHNHVIEILYTSGVLAAAGYAMFLLSGLSFVIRCVRAKVRYRSENLLALMAFTGYFAFAMLEIMIYPTSCITSLMLYISIVPIAMREKKRSGSEK